MAVDLTFTEIDEEFDIGHITVPGILVPTAVVSKIGTVSTLTVTDVNGTTTTEINDGAKGDKGDTGETGPTGAGVVVEANPSETATGTLSSIKIGQTNYSVGGGGTMYRHNVNIYTTALDAYLTLISTSSIAITKDTICSALVSASGALVRAIQCSGKYYSSSSTLYNVINVYANSNTIIGITYYTSSNSYSSQTLNASSVTIYDNVSQIV